MIAELSPHPAPPTISTGVSITFIAPTSSLATVLPIALIRYLCLIPDHLVNYRLFATLPRGRNLLDIGQHPERIEILANRMQLPVAHEHDQDIVVAILHARRADSLRHRLDDDAVILRRRILNEIGRAHVCTPVTNAHLVCRLLL